MIDSGIATFQNHLYPLIGAEAQDRGNFASGAANDDYN